MNNNEKNTIDKFLDYVEEKGGKKYIRKRIYEKPAKWKCIIGFIFTLIILYFLLRLFSFSLMSIGLILLDILFLTFFSINLFTEKGFGLPRTILIEEEKENKE